MTTLTHLHEMKEIVLPRRLYAQVVEHAYRKLRGDYLPDEEQAPKAYGLLAGRLEESRTVVTRVFPLRRNLRHEPRYKTYIDGLMEEVAVPSTTPFSGRGWVSDPAELMAAEQACEEDGSVIFCGYHMHRVAWANDAARDRCTTLDTRLAQDSGLWMLIVSMVDPERPRLRAFFEGDNDREAPVRLGNGDWNEHGR